MTNEFKELTNRLAKGLNFDGGMVILATQSEGEDEATITIKGRHDQLLNGICGAIQAMLDDIESHTDALTVRAAIVDVLIGDARRRCREGEPENG